MVVQIRLLTAGDVDRVSRALGSRSHYVDRIARQEAGRGEQLIAWEDQLPVGAVYLWLEPPDEPEIARHLPGVPLINNLIVAEPQRGEGIGSLLIDEVERSARERGFRQLALGVDVDNPHARRLYQARGYRAWPHGVVTSTWTAADERGIDREYSEVCVILVKSFSE